ncbi:S49 family peptidase [Bradyrhizobium sp. USDA 4471]
MNRPLMIHPDKLALIASVLEGRIGIDATELRDTVSHSTLISVEANGPDASQFVGSHVSEDGRRSKVYRVHKGVAIIPVLGSLVNRGAWLGARSGMTSYEGIGFQLDQAAADPDVKSVLLDIDSPGGEAAGAFEAADKVRSVAKSKPVTAVVNGMAASAAYAIASAASQIISTPSGVSGSIGVVLMHADYSGHLQQKGIRPTLIHAGAHKVDGHPYGPLPESVRADLQAEVDQFYQLFVSGVAKGRKGRMTDKAIRSTEARTYIGQAALDAGLVDAIGSFETVLADLTKGGTARNTNPTRTNSMSMSSEALAVAPPVVGGRTDQGAGVSAGPLAAILTVPNTAPVASTFVTANVIPPIAALPSTPEPAATGASWDEAVSSLQGKSALPLSHGWDAVLDLISGKTSRSETVLEYGWAEVVDAVCAGKSHSVEPGYGWMDIIANLNAESRQSGETDHGWSDIVANLNAGALR